MINLIVILFALLCMQTIQASSFEKNKDDNDLSQLREDALTFFTKFEIEHEKSRAYVKSIKDICEQLTTELNKFTSENYGTNMDVDQIKCEIKTFLDSFSPQRENAINYANDLLEKIDKLLNMAAKFSETHNLTREDCTCRGSNTDLNELRCKLTEFLDGLKPTGEEAKNYVDDIKWVCFALGEVAKKFTVKHNLTCENVVGSPSSRAGRKKFLRDVKEFFAKLKSFRDDADSNLNQLKVICDTLAAAINTWQATLEKRCRCSQS